MKPTRFAWAALAVMLGWGMASGNPIPPPAEEWLNITIEPSTGTLRARVDGDFAVLPSMDYLTTMSFPVPP